MEEKQEKRGNKVLVILAVILGVVFAGVSSYLIFDKLISKTDDAGEVENSDDIINLDIESDIVVDTFSIARANILESNYENSDYFAYYYRKDQLLVRELSDTIKIALTLEQYARNLSESEVQGQRTIFSQETAKLIYHRIFGEAADYGLTTQDYIDATAKHAIWPAVIKNRDGLIVMDVVYEGYVGEGDYVGAIASEITKAQKNSTRDELYIYQKVAFLDIQYEAQKVDVYTDYKLKNRVVSGLKIDPTINYLKKVDSADIFRFSFKVNDDGSYYFYSIDKVIKE